MSDFELVSGGSSPRSTSSVESPGSATPGDADMAQEGPPSARAAPTDGAQAGGAASGLTPQMSMRPITTHINLLVCGASGTGKTSFIRACTRLLCPAGKTPVTAAEADSSADPHAVLVAGPGAFETVLSPVLAPKASRELLYKFQDCPGRDCTLDPSAYAEALLTYVLAQQEKDYPQLQGGRSMNKSLACGSLAHSITAALYFLPPHGPSKLDLVLMAALSRHVPLVPVVGKGDTITQDEAQACCEAVRRLLERPGEAVPGMVTPIHAHAFGGSGVQPLLLHTRDDAACTKLAELLASNEVYGLLDEAWEKYVAFCDSYEAEGKWLAALLADECKALEPACISSMRSAGLLKQQLAQLRCTEMELQAANAELQTVKAALQSTNAELEDTKAELAQESAILSEICAQGKNRKASVALRRRVAAARKKHSNTV